MENMIQNYASKIIEILDKKIKKIIETLDKTKKIIKKSIIK